MLKIYGPPSVSWPSLKPSFTIQMYGTTIKIQGRTIKKALVLPLKSITPLSNFMVPP